MGLGKPDVAEGDVGRRAENLTAMKQVLVPLDVERRSAQSGNEAPARTLHGALLRGDRQCDTCCTPSGALASVLGRCCNGAQ